MAQKKAYEVAAWLARPDPATPIVLIYGPDRGLVSERAQEFARQTGVPLDDPFSVVRLDASEADENGRLREEAASVSMFSARRLLWVRNVLAHKNIAGDIKELCSAPPLECTILIEAGELKKGSPLRSAVEGSVNGMALPCYADEARDLDRLLDEILGREQLRLSLDARTALRRNLGGDRLASRAEIEKLALYAQGMGEVTLADVETLTGDVSDKTLDDVIDSVLTGKLADFDTAFQRHASLGGQISVLLSSMLRQMQALQVMRAGMDAARRSAAQVIAEARPPIFFSRKKTIESALFALTTTSIDRSLERLSAAILQTRKRADLAESLTRQALLGIAFEINRAGRQ